MIHANTLSSAMNTIVQYIRVSFVL